MGHHIHEAHIPTSLSSSEDKPLIYNSEGILLYGSFTVRVPSNRGPKRDSLCLLRES